MIAPKAGDVVSDVEDQGPNVSPRYGWSLGIIGTDGARYDALWGFEDTRARATTAMRNASFALASKLTDRVTNPRRKAKS